MHTKITFMTCRLSEAVASVSAGAPGGVPPGASPLELDVGVIGCYPRICSRPVAAAAAF